MGLGGRGIKKWSSRTVMKLSKFLERLQELQRAHGDCELYIRDTDQDELFLDDVYFGVADGRLPDRIVLEGSL